MPRTPFDDKRVVPSGVTDAEYILDIIFGDQSTTERTLHVSPAGNNTTGNGSKALPYLTLEHAQNQITDNAYNKIYTIILAPGTYAESATFVLKPYVNLIGAGRFVTTITRSGGMTLTYPGPAASGIYNQVFSDLSFGSAVTITRIAGAAVSSAQMTFRFHNCSFSSTLTSTGSGTGPTVNQLDNIHLYDCNIESGTTINAMSILMLGCRAFAFTFTDVGVDGSIPSSSFSSIASLWSSRFTTMSISGFSTVQARNVTVNSVTLQNKKALWSGDAASYPAGGAFTLNGGSTLEQVTKTSRPIGLRNPVRVATTSPVTVAQNTDYYVGTDLTVAGPVSVTLPTLPVSSSLLSNGISYTIADVKGDASVNNITIGGNFLITGLNGQAAGIAFDELQTSPSAEIFKYAKVGQSVTIVAGTNAIPGTYTITTVTPTKITLNAPIATAATSDLEFTSTQPVTFIESGGPSTTVISTNFESRTYSFFSGAWIKV